MGTAHRPRFVHVTTFGYAVTDVIHSVVARHILLLQEIGGVAFALGEHGNEHIRARDLFAARRLNMDDGALDHALKTGRWLRFFAVLDNKARKFIVDIICELLAQQAHVHIAGAHHGGCVLIVHQRKQQVLKRCIFMIALIGERQRAVKAFFQAT